MVKEGDFFSAPMQPNLLAPCRCQRPFYPFLFLCQSPRLFLHLFFHRRVWRGLDALDFFTDLDLASAPGFDPEAFGL